MKPMTICAILAGCFLVASPGASTTAHATDCASPKCADIGKPGTKPENSVSSKITYTIWNDSGQPVRFRLPSGKTYRLQPGQRGSYRNTRKGEPLKIYVFNSGKTYTLKSGDHKFWWMKKESRVGFDQNYRFD